MSARDEVLARIRAALAATARPTVAAAVTPAATAVRPVTGRRAT